LLCRKEKAHKSAEEALKINPKFSLEYYAQLLLFENNSDLERFIAVLRKAEIPEHTPKER
jgi:hypothetical protein